MAQFVCPKCGFDEINELALCVVLHRVIEWKNSGEPEDWAQAEVDWRFRWQLSRACLG